MYFIQDYENWGCPDSFVDESYKLNLKKIVISDWLLKKVQEQGEQATLCYNGFDFNYFKQTVSPEDRSPFIIAMLYHENEVKRCQDAIKALEIVKKEIPQLRVNIFGQYKRPKLAEWFTYYYRPDKDTHNRILNEASIFIYASRAEGFCLPPAESMICGCAVCGTDIPGIPYQKNEVTTLSSPPMDPQTLAKNILCLIQNRELRLRIAHAGHNFICENYMWENSVQKFISEIE
jgi:glycosyltransferase involved in cell wall biosynthesis